MDCFHILDHASTSFQLKIKEAFHIQRDRPSLNNQLHQSHKSKIILLIFSHCHVLCTFRCYTYIISIFPTFKFNFKHFVHQSTEDDKSFCRNTFCKLKGVVVFFKSVTCLLRSKSFGNHKFGGLFYSTFPYVVFLFPFIHHHTFPS